MAGTRDRIKTEAVALFAARGVDAVSVRDIAAAVGMKPSNLYAHYAAKDDLIREMFAEGYAEYARQLLAVPPGPFAARLAAMVRLICRLHDSETPRFRFLLLTQHAALARLDGGPDNPVEVVQDLVAAAVHAGDIPSGDPALLTALVVGTVVQAATFHLYGRLAGGLVAVQDRLVQACLDMLHAEDRT